MPDYRETIIRLDHDAKTAEIWTENRGVIGKATRAGWTVTHKQAGGTWLAGGIRGVLVRAFNRPKRASKPGHGFGGSK